MDDYVPPRPSTPEQSGGYGFTYADRVAAWLLLTMLANTMPIGTVAGVPVDIRFEQRPAGELYDDLVVRTDTGARWSLTVKSGDVVIANAVDPDLVARAWWMLDNPPAGSTDDDLLVIAQPHPGIDVRRTFDGLVSWATNQATGQTSDWLSIDYVGNDPKRAMWKSVRGVDATRDPQVLLQRLRLLTLDLDPMLAPDFSDVRNLCEPLLEEPNRWEDLWNALLRIASEARIRAAQLTVDRVIRTLPQSLMLRDRGDVEVDTGLLRTLGASRAPLNRQIGGRIELNNDDHRTQLDQILAESRFILLTGESGIGKSVALAQWCEKNGAVYLSAEDLTEPADVLRRAGVRRPLDQILRLSRRRNLFFVIDQVDRLVDDVAIGNLALWVQVLRRDERVKIVFGCATGAAPVRQLEIARLVEGSLDELRFSRSEREALNAIQRSFPEFAAVLANYAPSPLLTTPRALDQLLSMGTGQWPETFAEFLQLVWVNRIQGGVGDAAVRSAVRRLADREAEAGNGRLSDEVDEAALSRLKSRGVVRDDGRWMTWDHDSTGDQIRALMLSEEEDEENLPARLDECVLNPLWRRAFRLHCVSTLERDGAEGFDRLMATVAASEDASLLQTAIFDAVVLCPAQMGMPERLGGRLIRDEKLMRRFIQRFLYAASRPGVEATPGKEGVFWRAHIRFPAWDRWLPTARLVLSQKEWFARRGVGLGLEVLVPYLEAIGENDFFGAAPFALILGYSTLDHRPRPRSYEEKTKNFAFRAGVAALASIPDHARKFLRRCAGRIGATPRRPSARGFRPMMPLGPYLPPVPLGPKSRIDDEFQKFYGLPPIK